MHHISINQDNYQAPSKWSELTVASLLRLAIYFHFIPAHRHQLRKYYMVYAMFQIPKRQYLPNSFKEQLIPCIDWVYENNQLHAWLIKSLRIGIFRYYSPKDRLANLTAEEFMQCEAAYERYLNSQDYQYLDTLVAVLYRRRHWFTGKRIAFDPDKVDAVEKQATKLKNFVKRAIAINYAGCRNLIIERHPNLWKRAEGGEMAMDSTGKLTPWPILMMGLAGDKFGTYKEMIKNNVWLVLADMDTKAKHYDEMKVKYGNK